MTANLPDFFRHGVLGSIRLGLTKSEVLDLVGLPDRWSDSDYGTQMLASDQWNFESCTVFFDNDCVTTFGIYFSILEVAPSWLETEGFSLCNTSSSASLMDFLRKKGIEYKLVSRGLFTEGEVWVFLPNGFVCNLVRGLDESSF